MRQLFSRLLLLAVLLLPMHAFAEQKKEFDGYEVHYAAMLTSDLTAEVARAYDIPRSTKRAFVMIHTRKTLPEGSTSISTSIEGKVSNMLGQVRKMEWQQVKEEDSIYSLAHFPVTNREWATFTLSVRPDGDSVTLPLQFRQQFYTD